MLLLVAVVIVRYGYCFVVVWLLLGVLGCVCSILLDAVFVSPFHLPYSRYHPPVSTFHLPQSPFHPPIPRSCPPIAPSHSSITLFSHPSHLLTHPSHLFTRPRPHRPTHSSHYPTIPPPLIQANLHPPFRPPLHHATLISRLLIDLSDHAGPIGEGTEAP